MYARTENDKTLINTSLKGVETILQIVTWVKICLVGTQPRSSNIQFNYSKKKA